MKKQFVADKSRNALNSEQISTNTARAQINGIQHVKMNAIVLKIILFLLSL